VNLRKINISSKCAGDLLLEHHQQGPRRRRQQEEEEELNPSSGIDAMITILLRFSTIFGDKNWRFLKKCYDQIFA
jgi:hypothetical protein